MDSPSNLTVPDIFEFRIGIFSEIGTLVQIPSQTLKKTLEHAYKQGSQICASMGENGLGKLFCDDYLGFIKESIKKKSFKNLKVLEIGCGKGFLLKLLKQMGAEVVGIEPCITSPIYAHEVGIKILGETFSKELLQERFDIILHYGVLEHVFSPKQFMADQLEILNPNGLIIFSVPDCTEHINCGDISMFVHEHISYFNRDSLECLSQCIRAKVTNCQKSSRVGAIYSVWTHGEAKPQIRDGIKQFKEYSEFKKKAQRNLQTLKDFLDEIYYRKETLGVYCPGRFINYHYLLKIDRLTIRYFDDNPPAQGKFFPPIDIAVEPREALIKKPVNHLLIMSRSYDRLIKNDLKKIPALRKSHILTIDQLFDSEH
jgi:SAM-dependent methyltransferase